MKEDSVKMRLRAVLEAYNENPTSLARRFNANQKTLHNQIYGTTSVAVSTILLISEALPDMSLEWLLRGIGDNKLKQNSAINNTNINKVNSDNTNDSSVIDRLLSQLSEKDKQIEKLLKLLDK